MLNNAGQTMLLTHSFNSGNQMVIESSASDGTRTITTCRPAISVSTGPSNVWVGATNPSVNGAWAGLRNQGPSPALSRPSGPSAGRVIPNWWTSPRRIVGPASTDIRARLTRIRSCPQIGYSSRWRSVSIALVPAT
ncbi:MAG: hypothetical protein R2705_24195 [Ilumatobacteraceae bacterium]